MEGRRRGRGREGKRSVQEARQGGAQEGLEALGRGLRVGNADERDPEAFADVAHPRIAVGGKANHFAITFNLRTIPKVVPELQVVALESVVDISLVPTPEHLLGRTNDTVQIAAAIGRIAAVLLEVALLLGDRVFHSVFEAQRIQIALFIVGVRSDRSRTRHESAA